MSASVIVTSTGSYAGFLLIGRIPSRQRPRGSGSIESPMAQIAPSGLT